MAKDTIELLEHVGWTDQRQLHVIGVSMGGMDAEELVIMSRTRLHMDHGLKNRAGLENSRYGSISVVNSNWTKNIQYCGLFRELAGWNQCCVHPFYPK